MNFPLTIQDTSTVTALGFRVAKHFLLTVKDTSTVNALGFQLVRPGLGGALIIPADETINVMDVLRLQELLASWQLPTASQSENQLRQRCFELRQLTDGRYDMLTIDEVLDLYNALALTTGDVENDSREDLLSDVVNFYSPFLAANPPQSWNPFHT
jgi:hypothetical protein